MSELLSPVILVSKSNAIFLGYSGPVYFIFCDGTKQFYGWPTRCLCDSGFTSLRNV